MQTTKFGFTLLGTLSACTLLLATLIFADSANAGAVSFSDISQSTQTPGDPADLYGVPDTSFPSVLSFPSPVMFSASASGPGGSDITDSLLTFKVTADPGTFATSFNLTELVTVGIEPELAGNFANVFAGGGIKITGINNVPVNGAIIPFSLDETYFSSGAHVIETSVPLGPNVTSFNVSMNNRLIAISELGVSFIDKKFVDIEIETTMIPEPTTLALAAFGLVSILLKRRNS